MVRTVVKKVMVAMIGGLQCGEEISAMKICATCFPVCRVLRICSSNLGMRGWQHRWTTFQVVLLEYHAMIFKVKTQCLAFIGCTWQWSCERHYFGIQSFSMVKTKDP